MMAELVRFTLEITKTGQDKLRVLAKALKISQSEVLATLIDMADQDDPALIAQFEQVRKKKLKFREAMKEARAKIKAELLKNEFD